MKTTRASILETAAAIVRQAKEDRAQRLSLLPGIFDEQLNQNAVILAQEQPVVIRISNRDYFPEDMPKIMEMLDEAGFLVKNWRGYDDVDMCFEVKIKPETE